MASAPSLTDAASLRVDALLNGPAGIPPPGVLSDFVNPPNLDTRVYIAITVGITFASLAVLIRIYTRIFLLRSVGYDDYTSLISWLGLIGYLISGIKVIKAGAGINIWNLQLKKFFGLLYWLNIITTIYCPTVFFVKLSILLQYSRIFTPTVENNLILVASIRICICTIFLFYMTAMFFNIFLCSPREMIWNKLETDGFCYNNGALEQASGIFNILSDFAILLLPLYSIWRLHMTYRKKLLTTAVFAIGFLACVTSIVRTYYTWKIIESSDVSYLSVPFGLWSWAELSAGIVVGCFPVMPRFFQHVGPGVYRIFTFGSGITNSSGYGQRARAAIPRTNAFIKITNPFDKYDTGTSIPDEDRSPDTHIHDEHYILDELPRNQERMAGGVGIPTRRDDLEHGLPSPEVLRPPITVKRQTI